MNWNAAAEIHDRLTLVIRVTGAHDTSLSTEMSQARFCGNYPWNYRKFALR